MNRRGKRAVEAVTKKKGNWERENSGLSKGAVPWVQDLSSARGVPSKPCSRWKKQGWGKTEVYSLSLWNRKLRGVWSWLEAVGVLDEPLGAVTDQRHKMGCSSFSKGKVAIGCCKCRVLGTERQASCCSQDTPWSGHRSFKLMVWIQEAVSPTSAPSSGVLFNPAYLMDGMATHSSILAWRIPMDRGAWRAVVHGVAKSQTRLSN